MAHNIDPKAEGITKGILPTHMRQGMPPYLQILFAARPKLPFVEPIKKPHPIKVNGFFDKIDIKQMKLRSDQLRQQKLNQSVEVPENAKRNYWLSFVRHSKKQIWKSKFENHLRQQKKEYQNWLDEKDKKNDNKTGEPKNTLVVYNLVY